VYLWYSNRLTEGEGVLFLSIWITGPTRSGKTTALVKEFSNWVKETLSRRKKVKLSRVSSPQLTSAVLVFAANDDNKQNLVDKLSIAIQGSYPVVCKTPLGFISDEVMLFWPLLFERLNLKAQFPLRLRPETEQELATRIWRPILELDNSSQIISEYRLVRRTLDLLQLAGASCIPTEEIPKILEQGLPQREWEISEIINPFAGGEDYQLWKRMGKLLPHWRQWCLERGLLSYGIIYELYWRYLLPDSTYQYHLTRRYQAVFADDVDDYPAIARNLFDFLLDRGALGVFTFNPQGQIRLGLNADPNYLAGLASRCKVEVLNPIPRSSLGLELGHLVVKLVDDPTFITSLPDSVQSIQTISRAELLRKTAEIIIESVKSGKVEPQEVAVIAPGLDEIGRYTLIEILSYQGIPVEPLNEQRPLIAYPIVRALLTLLGLVYPGLGRLVDRDAVAEMLVFLSRKPKDDEELKERRTLIPDIDPVRAGLLSDYCYAPDPELPQLLSVESFPRWDRLGHRATVAYQGILTWLEQIKSRQHNAIALLNLAIKHFLDNGSNLPYDQLVALRELMETAQHYWEVDKRLKQNEPTPLPPTTAIAQFILLLRRGTITANPRPIRYLKGDRGAVTLATIFQYRSSRSFHRWQFWLDAASNLWEQGGAATLFAAPLFLREWSGRAWMPEDQVKADRDRLQRILRDLLGRVGERVYLCHSDLGINGNEQIGPLLTLVHISEEYLYPDLSESNS
jgi:hypothetical protein